MVSFLLRVFAKSFVGTVCIRRSSSNKNNTTIIESGWIEKLYKRVKYSCKIHDLPWNVSQRQQQCKSEESRRGISSSTDSVRYVAIARQYAETLRSGMYVHLLYSSSPLSFCAGNILCKSVHVRSYQFTRTLWFQFDSAMVGNIWELASKSTRPDLSLQKYWNLVNLYAKLILLRTQSKTESLL